MPLSDFVTTNDNILTEQFLNVLLNDVPKESQLLPHCTRIRDMTRNMLRIPVESNFVNVEFVDAGGAKPVTKADWSNVFVHRYELAGITLFNDQELQDARAQGRDMMGVIRTQFRDAAIEAMENAILFSETIPNAKSVYKRAVDAGSVLTPGLSLYNDLLGKGGLRYLVLKDGYRPNLYVGGIEAEADLIGLTDADGRPMYFPSIRGDGNAQNMIGNIPLIVQPNQYWDNAKAAFICGDFSKVVYSMGTEFEFNISNQATIKTPDGEDISLFQKDMTALRFKFTFGFNTANPLNRSNQSVPEDERSPFAILTPAP